MPIGSQVANFDTMATLTGLTHDIFVGRVVNNVRRESKVAQLFTDASPGVDYKLEGQNTVFATDLRFATGAMASSGNLPDHVGLDPIQGRITPVRRYRRIALDNFVEKRASGSGAFDDLSGRIFDILWDSWKSMEIRHSIGASTGIVAKVSSRTSSTVVVLKDGYGHTGCNPLLNLSEGSIIGWYDVSASTAGGAAKIASINYSTNTVTLDSATTWETDGGNNIAADDLIYFATTNKITRDYFELERGLAPNGLGTIVDPGAAATTVFNISQTTYPRWKPFRQASATFDHLEVEEFKLKLGQKRGYDVDSNDVAVTHPGAVAQLARSLMGLQQQAYSGGTLQGGYSGVQVGNTSFVQDGFFYQDVMMLLPKDKLIRANLGGDADFWGEDGSKWSRTTDFDGKEAYVVDYLNYFSTDRGAFGALTGITTPDITETDFDPIPNY
jgi:hypothetical protein